ncbi:MAG: hypothetical protein E6Q97_00530 [Desulfurellales bacterium]|nr:MAG: hypothetical protein E6Q97_00530 [Desulfurellales bacterium]
MSKALAPLNINLPALTNDDFDQLAEVAKGSQYLPRIQLITKGKYVDTGKIPPGHWGVPQSGGEEIEDLGDKIDIIPFTFRPKAMDVSDREAIVTVFDTADPEFVRISTAGKDSGCLWGPTFLVYERNTRKFYEMFFSNASGRSEAAKLRPFLPSAENNGCPSAATLSIRYKKTTQYGWHVPVVSKCTMPFDDLPDTETILNEVKKFRETVGGVEKVTEPETKNTRAR